MITFFALVKISRYPFSCHVVPFPLFRPSLTRVYEKKLFFDTFCRKKHCICNVRHAKVHFPKKCSFCVFLVFLVFFLGTHSRAMVYFSYRFMPCLVLLGFSCFMLFPFFCSLSISFCVFLVFFSRYPFSCHVVPFPLFRPSLTCVYEKNYFSILFAEKNTVSATSDMRKYTFWKKMYRYIFDVPKRRKMYITFWEVPPP